MIREKYESLAVHDLKEIAKARGIKGLSTMKKAEVIDAMLRLDAQENAEIKTERSVPESRPAERKDAPEKDAAERKDALKRDAAERKDAPEKDAAEREDAPKKGAAERELSLIHILAGIFFFQNEIADLRHCEWEGYLVEQIKNDQFIECKRFLVHNYPLV